jgi:hypothetical protein
MAGHYKGVADVRLRIVHADRIAALQVDANTLHAAETRQVLLQDLGSAVGDYVATGTTGDAPVDESVANAAEAFSAAIAEPGSDLAAAIDALEEALRAAMDVGTSEAPDPDATTVDVETEPLEEASAELIPEAVDAAADPIGELVAALRAMVEAASSADSAPSVLPELSGYDGNGRAYEKFLAMYQSSWSGAEVEADQSSGLDLAA